MGWKRPTISPGAENPWAKSDLMAERLAEERKKREEERRSRESQVVTPQEEPEKPGFFDKVKNFVTPQKDSGFKKNAEYKREDSSQLKTNTEEDVSFDAQGNTVVPKTSVFYDLNKTTDKIPGQNIGYTELQLRVEREKIAVEKERIQALVSGDTERASRLSRIYSALEELGKHPKSDVGYFDSVLEKSKQERIEPGDVEPDNVFGTFAESFKQGAVNLLANLSSGIELVGQKTNSDFLIEAGRESNSYWEQVLIEHPEWETPAYEWTDPKKYAQLIGSGLPSILGALSVGITAELSVPVIGVGGATAVVALGGTAYGGLLEGGATYDEALSMGASQDDAEKLGSIVGIVNGAIETVPIFGFFLNRLPGMKAIKGQLVKNVARKVFQQTVIEGTEEVSQQLVSNAIASAYDENRKLFDQLLESAVGGALLGGLTETGVSTFDKVTGRTQQVADVIKERNLLDDSKQELKPRNPLVVEAETLAKTDTTPETIKRLREIRNQLPTEEKPQIDAIFELRNIPLTDVPVEIQEQVRPFVKELETAVSKLDENLRDTATQAIEELNPQAINAIVGPLISNDTKVRLDELAQKMGGHSSDAVASDELKRLMESDTTDTKAPKSTPQLIQKGVNLDTPTSEITAKVEGKDINREVREFLANKPELTGNDLTTSIQQAKASGQSFDEWVEGQTARPDYGYGHSPNVDGVPSFDLTAKVDGEQMIPNEFGYFPESTRSQLRAEWDSEGESTPTITKLGEETQVYRGAKDQKLDFTRENGITGGISFSTDQKTAQNFAKREGGNVANYTISKDARVINHSILEPMTPLERTKYVKDNQIDVVRFDVPEGTQGEAELRVLNPDVLLTETQPKQPKSKPREQLPGQQPVVSRTKTVKESKAFSRVRDRLQEQTDNDTTYNPVNLEENARRAVEYIEKNPVKALRIAKGIDPAPSNITETAIAIALAENAALEKDYKLQADLEASRSLRQTRRGQEIVTERGRFNDESPHRYMQQLLATRLSKVGKRISGLKGLAFSERTDVSKQKQAVVEKIATETTKAAKKVDTIKTRIQSAQEIIDALRC